MVVRSKHLDADVIAEVCKRWRVTRLWLFGSATRGELGPDSDLDLLVEFDDAATWSLIDHATLRLELESLLGRPVDLMTRRAIERSENPIRRRSILDSAELIFDAA